ncbi:MAG: hypothetical protein OXH66_10060 [Gemmatimonadetes bacterium]|nr:hypothetical protein [Gemmatimonadota bacterium]
MTDHVAEVLSIARELRPDLYERTEAVARIIDPVAFADPWICSDPKDQKLTELRRDVMRANAFATAQKVLEYLGVNTSTDWLEILTRIAKDGIE